MPLTIDISDAAIEKTEKMHHLHLWGVRISLWAKNCLVCGKATNWKRIRCRHRPSPNHRRALVIHIEMPSVKLVWAEVQGSNLIIHHPSLDEYYKPRTGADRVWVDLAVINPALDLESFRKIGHGIAMGFASITMDPRYSVDPSERNGGLGDLQAPCHKLHWAGPLIFFCYGYDMNDYIKVDPARSDNTDRGAEAGMTELEIWNELEGLRWERNRPDEPETKARPREKPGRDGMVWKWKVKEHGTSMEVLDLHHHDYSIIVDYLKASHLNRIPSPLPGSPDTLQAVHVSDPNHPGNQLDKYWEAPEGKSLAEGSSPVQEKPLPIKEDKLRFDAITLPAHPPKGFLPMVGALAVGLRWMVKYSMDINPPFRGSLPDTHFHGPLRNLLWAARLTKCGDLPTLELRTPGPTCDSAIVTTADTTSISAEHVRALLKYLDFIDPFEWSRHGPRGFEVYWKTYAVVELKNPRYLDPYEAAEMNRAVLRYFPDHAAAYPDLEREVAHMTMENLTPEDQLRVHEIGQIRKMILKVIRWYRDTNTKFAIGRGPSVFDRVDVR
ncbi:hypothetical protein N657DRAFT_711305 [Parathielavia appendiculata]|uniref:Uncharacterized protein n=1 Tax=Parathielavia appendiculata TaxID=2587402 RepID=A0AAN6YYK6_9PEZI|nr:hypothetical protein N657DRAFT_711305 [Parathielavia appendiculata]